MPSTELHFCLQSPWEALPGSSCSAGAWLLAAQVSEGYWGAGEPKVKPGLYAPQKSCSGVWGQAVPVSLCGTSSLKKLCDLRVTLDLPPHPSLFPQVPWPYSHPASPSCRCQQSFLAQVRDPRGHGRA